MAGNREEIYKKFGIHIKGFLKDRYGSVKKACERLNLNPSLVSQYIRGIKKPNSHFHHLMQQLGFDMSKFDFVEGVFELENEDGALTYQEIKFLYLQIRDLLKEKNKIIEFQERKIREYQEKLGGNFL